MVRVHERGSSLWYIVVGVILAVLVVGGVYVVKHQLRGQLAGTSSTVTATTNQSDSEKGTVSTPPSTSETENESDKKDQSTTSVTGTTGGSQSDVATPTPAPQTVNPATAGTAGTSLPETGPASTFATATILALLAGAALTYRRSLKIS